MRRIVFGLDFSRVGCAKSPSEAPELGTEREGDFARAGWPLGLIIPDATLDLGHIAFCADAATSPDLWA